VEVVSCIRGEAKFVVQLVCLFVYLFIDLLVKKFTSLYLLHRLVMSRSGSLIKFSLNSRDPRLEEVL